jgi:diphthine synthase
VLSLVLILAGCGVHSGSLTLDLVRALDEADIVYVDTYTMPSATWVLEALKPWAGKVRVAGRELLEDRLSTVLEEAMGRSVLVVSAGDPLVATTHQTLLAEARRLNIEVKYIPGVSGVCTAKSYSGLSYYRFGRTATVPGPWRRIKPYSVIAVIYSNLCIDAHTLLLLDVDEMEGQLRPRDAAHQLLDVEVELSTNLNIRRVLHETPVMVVERAGARDAGVHIFNSMVELLEWRDDARAPSSIIVPAPLSATELWILESRFNVKLGDRWSRRSHERREFCRNYEILVEWLSQ